MPLTVTFNVMSMAAGGACTPLAGAHVDLWQCDELGVYSDVKDACFNTIGKKFLRGYQVTDAEGGARFTTIYPGWYRGRAVHIHFKIRTTRTASGHEFTSQLYFDDALTDRVFEEAPYASKGQGRTRNASDRIFQDGGAQLVLALEPRGDGCAGTFNVAMHPGIKPEDADAGDDRRRPVGDRPLLTEPRIDDAAEDRAEGIRQAHAELVLVAALQLSQPEQDLLVGRAAGRQRQLIANARRVQFGLDRQPAGHAHRHLGLDLEARLVEVVQILRPLRRGPGACPIAHAARSVTESSWVGSVSFSF